MPIGQKIALTTCLLLLAAWAAAQCKANGNSPPRPPGPFQVNIVQQNSIVGAGQLQFFQALQGFHSTRFTDVTQTGRWYSSNPAIAFTDPFNGITSALSAGVACITFQSGPYAAVSTRLTVVTPAVVRVQVGPQNPSLAVGNTQAFTATAIFNDGSTLPVTNDPNTSWAALDPSIATNPGFDNNFKGISAGTTSVVASYNDINGITASGQARCNVGLLNIASISPPNASVPAGPPLIPQVQFTALGNFGVGPLLDVTQSVNWSSSNNSVAAIDPVFGQATAVSPGTTMITAASPGATSLVVPFTVKAAQLLSITVSPSGNITIPTGGQSKFTAIGSYSDKSTQNLTGVVTWSSSMTSVATIASGPGGGDAVAAGTGATLITAAYTDPNYSVLVTSNTADLHVGAPVLQTITVTPMNATLFAGATLQYTATGLYSNGKSQDITSQVAWSSDNTSAASISATGLATAVTAGKTAHIQAALAGVTGSTMLTVNNNNLLSITVAAGNTSVNVGATLQYTAMGHYQVGPDQNITNTVTWGSSNTGVATISPTGLATGLSPGPTMISASLSGIISPQVPLTVNAPTLMSIAVTPNPITVAANVETQFTATATFSDNSTQDITSAAGTSWSSGTPAVATVNDTTSKGLALGLTAGVANITATDQNSGLIGSASMIVRTVTSGDLKSLTIAPLDSTVRVSKTLQFTATGTFTDNSTRDLTSQVSWTSDDPSIVMIDKNTGLATGIHPTLTVHITATSGTFAPSTTLLVTF